MHRSDTDQTFPDTHNNFLGKEIKDTTESIKLHQNSGWCSLYFSIISCYFEQKDSIQNTENNSDQSIENLVYRAPWGKSMQHMESEHSNEWNCRFRIQSNITQLTYSHISGNTHESFCATNNNWHFTAQHLDIKISIGKWNLKPVCNHPLSHYIPLHKG